MYRNKLHLLLSIERKEYILPKTKYRYNFI